MEFCLEIHVAAPQFSAKTSNSGCIRGCRLSIPNYWKNTVSVFRFYFSNAFPGVTRVPRMFIVARRGKLSRSPTDRAHGWLVDGRVQRRRPPTFHCYRKRAPSNRVDRDRWGPLYFSYTLEVSQLRDVTHLSALFSGPPTTIPPVAPIFVRHLGMGEMDVEPVVTTVVPRKVDLEQMAPFCNALKVIWSQMPVGRTPSGSWWPGRIISYQEYDNEPVYHSADTSCARVHILILYLRRDVIHWVPGRKDIRVWEAGLAAGYYELGRKKPALVDALVAVRNLCTDLHRRQRPYADHPAPNSVGISMQ